MTGTSSPTPRRRPRLSDNSRRFSANGGSETRGLASRGALRTNTSSQTNRRELGDASSTRIASRNCTLEEVRENRCGVANQGLRERLHNPTAKDGGTYILTNLRDLAGVRVLAFPRARWTEANDIFRTVFPSWESRSMPDPVSGTTLVHKYNVYLSATDQIRAELQISPRLIGQFLDIEP